ncbi:ATP-binding cassette domain-containing protein [Herbiconiux sp. KACC 21604]|uniref:ATP-binding cassette domain-containing protein n=1 Tax=unclassified Herbiconiux TaxID=2618217 RepID=UPI001491C854|nr:ATP-binding cassette domain-containing protein [Herbiconiux sp. SALV-R1]QJU52598.1 ATP-binding cassette domain-containing protein [Herbiconiux sp. SALV-R1]WPO87487.1 ATP-binding cassette domain-containing protein [Herbiconiux sp. KACC 21604]
MTVYDAIAPDASSAPVTGTGSTAPASAGVGGPVLELQGIVKTFPGVRALTDVTLEVLAGEVHALVGENGAGKSTLMAVASGALAPDSGTVTIAGTELASASPDAARELGLGIVRQDPALLPDLTVAENMAVGVGYRRVGGLRRAVAWSQKRLDPWGMGIDAKTRVADLSVEQRFIVEIAKALALDPKVLILDEPTEHLSLDEVQKLFVKVRELAAAGTAIVYISHRIPEVKQISDRITVLRDGQVRGTFPASEVNEQQIVERVVGRKLETVFPEKSDPEVVARSASQLTVKGLRGDDFHDVDFTVAAGEIIGLAGVQGNGQAALIRALAGLEPTSGTIEVAGRPVSNGSNAAAASAGVVYVPADRHGEGVFLPLSVGDNISAKTLPQVSRGGMVSERKVLAVAAEQIRRLAIKTPSARTPIQSLSGGNQQKAVLARTLLSKPAVLLAEEPTQGVDAGARVDIYRILRDAADAGAAVVILSSDGVELEGLCDRVLIMSRGQVVQELVGDEVSEAAIARAALTSTTVRERTDSDKAAKGVKLRRFLRGDQSPAAVLGAIFLLLGVVVAATNPAYLGAFNINNLLFMAAPLLFVGAAQQVVVLGSGFDLSVGPLMGLLVVLASYWIVDGGNLYVGIALMVVGAIGTGVVNGFLVTRFAINPVVVTLAMYMALQGIYLTLRSTPGGIIFGPVADQIQGRIGIVPVVTIVAVVVLLVLEFALRRTRWGVELRGVGSRVDAAARLGIKVKRTQFLSYVLCSFLVLPAAVIMMAQIGIGDGRPSLSYTLSSVTVVVLAGASIFGGRGSFIGVLAAAFLVQQVLNVSPFLGLSQAWSYWLPGLITLAAAVLYAQLRRSRRRRLRAPIAGTTSTSSIAAIPGRNS